MHVRNSEMIEMYLSRKQIGKQQHCGENMKANSYAQEKLRFLQNRLLCLYPTLALGLKPAAKENSNQQ